MMKRNLLGTLSIAVILLGSFLFMRLGGSSALAQDQSRELSSADLQTVAAAGGILQVDASRYSAADLMNVAATAARIPANNGPLSVARLTIVNARRLSGADLANIASVGKGCVAFIVDR
jgi:hypothetical protein